MRLTPAAALVAAAMGLSLAASPAWAAGGKEQFDETCAECHALGPSSADAPTLRGVAGRKVASLTDFQYSAALKAKGGVWTEANLDAFLANPQTYAPGTTMYVSVASPADRKAIIDYLATVK